MTDETAAYVAITRLQAAYADVVTRRAWPELDGLFVPDAPVHIDTITGPEVHLVGAPALGEFIAGAVERFEFFEFVILNTVVEVQSDDRARGRVYLVEVRQERDGGAWSNAFGLYQDAYVAHDGRWRFGERRYQSLARRVGADAASIFPFPDVRPPGR